MYAILRTKRIKDTNKFTQMCMHNLRDRTNNEKNIDASKSHLNEILVDNLIYKAPKNLILATQKN